MTVGPVVVTEGEPTSVQAPVVLVTLLIAVLVFTTGLESESVVTAPLVVTTVRVVVDVVVATLFCVVFFTCSCVCTDDSIVFSVSVTFPV